MGRQDQGTVVIMRISPAFCSLGHIFQRLCEDGNHTVEDLHTTSIGRITALGYDWKGQNIYWIDEEFKSLEVSKPNGRFRRELLRGSRFFDKPRALTIDAHHG